MSTTCLPTRASNLRPELQLDPAVAANMSGLQDGLQLGLLNSYVTDKVLKLTRATSCVLSVKYWLWRWL